MPMLVLHYLVASNVWILMTSWCTEFLYINRTVKAIQFLPQAVLLHCIAKINANSHWDLNSLTLSIEPEQVFQYCTRNLAAGRRHIQSYYKYIAFYCAYVYRIEKYRIAARIFNTYRIVRHAYRYTPNVFLKHYILSIHIPQAFTKFVGTFSVVLSIPPSSVIQKYKYIIFTLFSYML